MSKNSKIPLKIFMESIGLYFSNIDKFFKYMSFPVLGQFLGILLTLFLTIAYSKNLQILLEKYPNINSLQILLPLTLIVILPGLAIFTKAFWEYLVAYGAINSMLDNLLKSGRVYDFGAHTQLIKQRTANFIGLWTIVAIFSILSACPLLWVLGAIFAVYIVLIFQVFTYESELSPIGCIKKSFSLVKGHFASTFMLIALVGALTYVLIPHLFIKILTILNLNSVFINLLQPATTNLPIDNYNQILTMYGLKPLTNSVVANFLFETILFQIIIQYTLPLRSILWALWYKELDKSPKTTSVKNIKNSKRPSEKLMEASNKKYGKKKLNRNLIERASKKDTDE